MKPKFKDYLNRILEAKDDCEKHSIKKEFDVYYSTLDEDGKKAFSKFVGNVRSNVKRNVNSIIEESNKNTIVDGNSYKLSDWVTSKIYCSARGIKLATLSNRISRG